MAAAAMLPVSGSPSARPAAPAPTTGSDGGRRGSGRLSRGGQRTGAAEGQTSWGRSGSCRRPAPPGGPPRRWGARNREKRCRLGRLRGSRSLPSPARLVRAPPPPASIPTRLACAPSLPHPCLRPGGMQGREAWRCSGLGGDAGP